MASENQENAKSLKSLVKGSAEKIGSTIKGAALEFKKLGEEDPRRIVHSLKVGLAITVVSLVYYFDFLYEAGFGVSAMWAVMTVVVVFEFSVGATLGKGVNRGVATLLGGALGVAAHRLASFAGEKTECIILGLSVFLIASLATFTRFYPKLKARYDYGIMIFILTFCLISVSGYREDEVIDMAYERLSTVLIGGAATVLICTLICPVWAGADLHKLMAVNIEKLAIFMEGFGHEYFKFSTDKDRKKKVSLDGYKSVLNGKGFEDSLVNFARWEPRHGRFRYRHPWDQYLKIGSLTRECANRIDALNAYLNSDVQIPIDIRASIQESCTKMSSECSYALRELALGIQTMTCSLFADPHLVNAKSAAKKLKATLKISVWPNTDLLDVIPAVAVASLLIEIVSCTVKIADSVHELASLAKFKSPDVLRTNQKEQVQKMSRTPSIEESHSFSIVVE